MRKWIVAALVSAALMSGCTNSDIARSQLMQESEDNCGVMRTVTAYQAGVCIGEWHGKIDVQYTYSGTYGACERVDLVMFDGNTAIDRVIISGDAAVVVDND